MIACVHQDCPSTKNGTPWKFPSIQSKVYCYNYVSYSYVNRSLSDAGFSVSFFWPAAPSVTVQRRRRKRKRRSHKSVNGQVQVGSARICTPVPSKAAATALTTASLKRSENTPIDAHPSASESPPAIGGQLSDTTPPFPNPKDLLSDTILPSSDPEEPLALTIMNSDIVDDDDNDSLQHLKDAEVIEFDIKNDEPGVKHTTDAGQTGWTAIGVMRNRHSSGSRSGEYDVAS